jgi:hypothetical protein
MLCLIARKEHYKIQFLHVILGSSAPFFFVYCLPSYTAFLWATATAGIKAAQRGEKKLGTRNPL